MVKAICSCSSACSSAGWESPEEAATKLLPGGLHSVLRTGHQNPSVTLKCFGSCYLRGITLKVKHFQTKKEQQNYYQQENTIAKAIKTHKYGPQG